MSNNVKVVRMRTNLKEKPLEMTAEMAYDLLSGMSQERLLDQISKEDPFLWIYNNVMTENGRKLDFSLRPYLKDVLRDFSPQIVYKKSAQVGITMCGGIAKCLYAVDTLGINSIYTFPTAVAVSDFSKARFRYIVRNSRYLKSRMGEIDNVGMVRIGDSVIYFRGASKDSQAISVPSDLNIHDELDFSDESVREVYSSRLDASSFIYNNEIQNGWEWDFSTPTLPRYGVSVLYEDSDKHEWWVRCERCRRRQRVDFFKNLRKTRRGRRFFGCRKCDKELNRAKGRWVAREPNALIRGYHITQPMAPYINADRMYRQWVRAKKTPQGRKKFYNFNLGLEYEDGSETVSRELIFSRVVESTVVPGPIYIGIDQGGGGLHHVVVSKLVNGIRRHIWIDTVQGFEQIDMLLDRYQPRICVIDALPSQENARRLAKNRHNVYLHYYGGKNKLEKKYWDKDLEKKELSLPRTDVLDRSASEWRMGNVVIEDFIHPKLIEEFVDQMTALKRTYTEDKNGTKDGKAEWVKVNDDHYRHADTYNWVATEIGTGSLSQQIRSSSPIRETQVSENIFKESDFLVPLGV